MSLNHDFVIGDVALRLNHNYPDEPQQWIQFSVNQTYMKLIDEFPEDYRTSDGRRWIKNKVKCDICEHEWEALYIENTEQIPCPNCKQMAYQEIIQ